MMKKMKHWLRHCNAASIMACLAMGFCVMSANARCCFVFHQPEIPDGLKKFKRF